MMEDGRRVKNINNGMKESGGREMSEGRGEGDKKTRKGEKGGIDERKGKGGGGEDQWLKMKTMKDRHKKETPQREPPTVEDENKER
uniref:Uncharacterized protein n=1 Tax=Nelumbo nucifera TaxID=4432 RepID=A0A822YJJ9_NELNU|nr:TPA_asm: hypothetical protein HUJ06_011134 [Nelumbo nucifera]